MIKILIVDDSKVQQEFLAHLLASDPDIKVIGFASSGYEAIELAKEKKPDVITMDIHMPGIDGYIATRKIMETIPTPIIIVSSSVKTKEVAGTFKSLEAGALAVVLFPPGFENPNFPTARKELIQTVKLMSEVKVIRRFPQRTIKLTPVLKTENKIQLIAIGASTGGPQVLQKILSSLPGDLDVPVLIVQHIAMGFIKGFVQWLSMTSGIKLKIAEEGEKAKPGVGYIAPDNYHMGVTRDLTIRLNDGPPVSGLKPSVNFLFHTVAENIGNNAIGVLLTGMGKDGAEELKAMKELGAITVVQNEETSVVFGMPAEALKIGAADQALSPEKIVEIIVQSCSDKK